MKMINRIWACIVICFGAMTSCFAQQDTQDQALLERIARIYHLIPQDLKTEELLKKVDEVDRQVNLSFDSLSGEEVKRKARLIRFNGLLWSMRQADEEIKKELEKRLQGLDLDSPELELLSDVEVTNLLNGYFQVFIPDLSSLNRATYVLYNVKSEKVRNAYVLPVLLSELKQRGYTGDIQGLLEDIELCSKTGTTIQKSKELKERYYPVREGAVAPDFEMEDEYGNPVKLSDFRGKIVFIDVWATWCGGCIEGLPYFMALKDQYKDRKDIVFMTISDDGTESKNRWLHFLKEKKYTGKMPHLIINKGKDQFVKDYCVTGIPRYILIDKEGKIVNAWHLAAKHELFPWIFKMELEKYASEG